MALLLSVLSLASGLPKITTSVCPLRGNDNTKSLRAIFFDFEEICRFFTAAIANQLYALEGEFNHALEWEAQYIPPNPRQAEPDKKA